MIQCLETLPFQVKIEIEIMGPKPFKKHKCTFLKYFETDKEATELYEAIYNKADK